MYSKNVLDHTNNPRNVGTLDSDDPQVGTGLVGSPACGDVMRLQIKIGEDGIVETARFKTFGCGSAIAASSLATEWIQGRSLEDAARIENRAIAEELNLPPVKLHCSVLAEDAIRLAIADYRKKQAANRHALRLDSVAVEGGSNSPDSNAVVPAAGACVSDANSEAAASTGGLRGT